MTRLSKYLWAPLLMAALCLPAARAQQQQPPPTNPVPPVAPVPAAGSQQTNQQEPVSPVVTSSPTVTGVVKPVVGEAGDTHSQITGGVKFSELFDSNLQNLSGGNGWDELTTLSGHVELHRVRAGTDLTFRYVGGGYIDPKNSNFDSTYHQFEATDTIQFRRWSLRLDDVFSYLPESSFGFGGDGLGGGVGTGLTFVNPFILPSQTILTNQGKRISNEALGLVQFDASPRSSWTFMGSYGLLHFTDSGNLDSTDTAFSVGYNHQMTARDVIGFSYLFNAFRFSPAVQSINDNTAQAIYGHHITERLMFQAGAGPDFYSLTTLLGPANTTHFSWAANASLAYQMGRTTINGSYSHGVTGGAGVLAGASSNIVQVGASRPFGQFTNASVSAGYAHNGSLPLTNPTTTTYGTVNASVGIDRKFGRNFSVYANYIFTHQVTNAGTCVGLGCANPFTSNQIRVGFSWDMRPLPLN